uniref:Uncharacterized protein n=1 Tax=Mycetohabitans sp. TaxID=2571162 RepID=A0A6B9HDG7_9BURK|nr:hypothetical protein [Mycetohabitans sp.]
MRFCKRAGEILVSSIGIVHYSVRKMRKLKILLRASHHKDTACRSAVKVQHLEKVASDIFRYHGSLLVATMRLHFL